jgi:hypothetical protein
MFSWISELKELATGIAFAVVYIVGLVLILRYVNRPFMKSIERTMEQNCQNVTRLVDNHLSHDALERKYTREAISRMSEALDRQCDVLQDLSVAVGPTVVVGTATSDEEISPSATAPVVITVKPPVPKKRKPKPSASDSGGDLD